MSQHELQQSSVFTMAGRITLVAVAAALFIALIALGLSACQDPCAGHGGANHTGGGWSYCNDGTQQAG